MIFLSIFCLYYVLHDRHHRTVTTNHISDPPMIKIKNEIFSSMYLPKSKFIGFSDYRFITCIALLILLGFFSLPIFGFTGFHIFLIARGRTTNEQVTGKFHDQNDAFTKGIFKNFAYIFCQSLYPQLKSPKEKRYNVEIFEKMAYDKNHSLKIRQENSIKKTETRIDNSIKQPKRKHKKIVRLENGKRNIMMNIHANPIDEESKSYYEIVQLNLFFFLLFLTSFYI